MFCGTDHHSFLHPTQPHTHNTFLFKQLHEFDELRFDVRSQDCSYFLRTNTVEEKNDWVDAIEANKVHSVWIKGVCNEIVFISKKFLLDNGFDEPIEVMRRQGSILSLSALSQTSNTSVKVNLQV